LGYKTEANVTQQQERRCDEIKGHVTEFVQIFGSILQDFFQVSKIAGQISRLFQEFKALYEP